MAFGLVQRRRLVAIATLGLLLLVGGVLSISCGPLAATGGQQAGQATPEVLRVEVYTVQNGSGDGPTSYTADVRARDVVNLVAKVPGRLEELRVEVGTVVTAGNLVAIIDHVALDAQLRQAEAALAGAQAQLNKLEAGPRPESVALAEANYEAARRGVEVAKNTLWAVQNDRDGICSLADRADKPMGYHPASPAYNCDSYTARCFQAEAAVRAAEAQEEAAKQQLALARSAFTEDDLAFGRASTAVAQAAVDLARAMRAEAFVRTPISGIVSRRFLSPGAMVGPTAPLLTIVSRDVKVDMAVEERSWSQFSVGMPVSLSVAAYPGVVFTGTVTNLAPAAEEHTRAFAVEIVPQDEEDRLRPGMFATVEVEQEREPMLIPAAAVVSKDGDSAVFVLDAGKASLKEVSLGPGNEAEVEVLSGLSHGDRIIVDPPPELEDGDAVRVDNTF